MSAYLGFLMTGFAIFFQGAFISYSKHTYLSVPNTFGFADVQFLPIVVIKRHGIAAYHDNEIDIPKLK